MRRNISGPSPQRGDRLAPSADDEDRGAAARRQPGPRGLRQQRQRHGSASSSSAASAASSSLKVGVAYDTGGRGDKSFNDSAFAGIQAAIKEHGGKFTELSPNADASNRADLLTQLADQGYNPVIAVGFAYGDVDRRGGPAVPEDHLRRRRHRRDGPQDAARPVQLHRAALRRERGLLPRRRGRGPEDEGRPHRLRRRRRHPADPQVRGGLHGRRQGGQAEIKIESKYISPAGDFSGFNDPAKGQIVAQGMFDKGADIVYAAAGGSGLGVFKAAAASKQAGHRGRLRPVPDRRRPGAPGRDHDVDAQAGRQRRRRSSSRTSSTARPRTSVARTSSTT